MNRPIFMDNILRSGLVIECSTKCRINLIKGGWKVAENSDDSEYVKVLNVDLSIQGNENNGFQLIMQPDGCFSADLYYNTLKEAYLSANETFGVFPDMWKPRNAI
jgi:hypothetical protein